MNYEMIDPNALPGPSFGSNGDQMQQLLSLVTKMNNDLLLGQQEMMSAISDLQQNSIEISNTLQTITKRLDDNTAVKNVANYTQLWKKRSREEVIDIVAPQIRKKPKRKETVPPPKKQCPPPPPSNTHMEVDWKETEEELLVHEIIEEAEIKSSTAVEGTYYNIAVYFPLVTPEDLRNFQDKLWADKEFAAAVEKYLDAELDPQDMQGEGRGIVWLVSGDALVTYLGMDSITIISCPLMNMLALAFLRIAPEVSFNKEIAAAIYRQYHLQKVQGRNMSSQKKKLVDEKRYHKRGIIYPPELTTRADKGPRMLTEHIKIVRIEDRGPWNSSRVRQYFPLMSLVAHDSMKLKLEQDMDFSNALSAYFKEETVADVTLERMWNHFFAVNVIGSGGWKRWQTCPVLGALELVWQEKLQVRPDKCRTRFKKHRDRAKRWIHGRISYVKVPTSTDQTDDSIQRGNHNDSSGGEASDGEDPLDSQDNDIKTEYLV